MAASAGASSLAAQAEAVYRERQQIEEKMEALASFLTAEGMPGLKGPLVDPEGFPRADIDVHAVLQARQQLACLKTDHREVQQRLEETLLLLHAANAKDKPPAAALQRSSIPSSEAPPQQREGPPQQQEASPQLLQEEGPPFAVVDLVQPGSPCSSAGVAAGDLLLRLGSLRLQPSRRGRAGAPGGPPGEVSGETNGAEKPRSAAELFQLLPSEVQRHEGQRMAFVVQRGGRAVLLWVLPRVWGGRGLLGCHLRPLQE